MYYCYMLRGKKNTYIGSTNNVARRIKQHNSKQGARFTRSGGPWKPVMIVSGFKTRGDAMRFEMKWKKKYPRDMGCYLLQKQFPYVSIFSA